MITNPALNPKPDVPRERPCIRRLHQPKPRNSQVLSKAGDCEIGVAHLPRTRKCKACKERRLKTPRETFRVTPAVHARLPPESCGSALKIDNTASPSLRRLIALQRSRSLDTLSPQYCCTTTSRKFVAQSFSHLDVCKFTVHSLPPPRARAKQFSTRKNHEHPECVVRALRQEPAEGHRLRMVHLDRDGDGGLHLRLRNGRAQRWGGERISRFRGRLDGKREGVLMKHERGSGFRGGGAAECSDNVLVLLC